MDSSDSSFESDVEFWQRLEEKPDLSQQLISLPSEYDNLGDIEIANVASPLSAKETVEDVTKLFLQSRPITSQDFRTHRRAERSLSNIEGATNVSAANVTVVVKSAAQREMEAAVELLKAELERNISTLEEAYDDLNVQLTRKNGELARSVKMFEDHRERLEHVGVRVQDARFLKIKRPYLVKEVEAKPYDKAKKLSLDFKTQLASLADVSDLYRRDRDVAVGLRNRLLKEKEDLLKQQADEVSVMKSVLESERIESEYKKERMLAELEEFKYEVNKELEIRSLLLSRQQDQINVLKEELKTAKTFLKNPRLRKMAFEVVSKSNVKKPPIESRKSSVNLSLNQELSHKSQTTEYDSKVSRPQTSKASSSPIKRNPLPLCSAPEDVNQGVLSRMLPAFLRLSR